MTDMSDVGHSHCVFKHYLLETHYVSFFRFQGKVVWAV
jgi:hypothetical protein